MNFAPSRQSLNTTQKFGAKFFAPQVGRQRVVVSAGLQ